MEWRSPVGSGVGQNCSSPTPLLTCTSETYPPPRLPYTMRKLRILLFESARLCRTGKASAPCFRLEVLQWPPTLQIVTAGVGSLGAGSRECLAVFRIFLCVFVFTAAFATGAGKSNVACQGTIISPTDDIVSIINSGSKNQTLLHRGRTSRHFPHHGALRSIAHRHYFQLAHQRRCRTLLLAIHLYPRRLLPTTELTPRPNPTNRRGFPKEALTFPCYLVTIYQDDLFFSYQRRERSADYAAC